MDSRQMLAMFRLRRYACAALFAPFCGVPAGRTPLALKLVLVLASSLSICCIERPVDVNTSDM